MYACPVPRYGGKRFIFCRLIAGRTLLPPGEGPGMREYM